MRTILVFDLVPLKLVAACLPLKLQDSHRVMAGGKGRSGHLGYQCVMRHCIKGSCQVYCHTHCTVRWFPLVEACLDVCFELEEGRCSRVSGSEAVLIFSW